MSDIQFACPHCGVGLSVGAEDAGTELECPECGGQMMAPAPEPEDALPQRTAPQKRQLKTRPRTTLQVPRTRKPSASQPTPAPAASKTKPVIIALVIAAILGGGIFFISSQMKAKTQRENAAKYNVLLQSTSALILKEAAECARVSKTVASEWQRFAKHAEGGTQIIPLQERIDKAIKKDADALIQYHANINDYMERLRTPPPSLRNNHHDLTTMHTAYEKLYAAVTSPSGALKDYTTLISDLQTELVAASRVLKARTP